MTNFQSKLYYDTSILVTILILCFSKDGNGIKLRACSNPLSAFVHVSARKIRRPIGAFRQINSPLPLLVTQNGRNEKLVAKNELVVD